MSELRWNPLLEEWVITATHRQDRTFFPPPDYNPLAPTQPGGFPTEIPSASYEIVVFENKFPSLRQSPPDPAIAGSDLTPVRPARGICEVICYTPDAEAELATLPVQKVHELIYVWTDRFLELGARDFVKYVYIFENKGKEIGVTLSHPHGQIYAYPFVPPIPRRELDAAHRYYQSTGRDLIGDVLQQELEDGRRLVAQNEAFVAVVPFFARYPYEVQIFPRAVRPALSDFNADERAALARILKTVIEKYNNLWQRSLPYIMLMHQRPTDGTSADYAYYRFHIEFYPPYRTPDKLKYLAGSEAGAGVFINDTLAEVTAETLRNTPPYLI
ncbi:MAG: galactose-1-phosphate uridylyltransferase [Chloroherpetonaceae bacterium]|nr:galactose-1-phosphate uridylyltransferase [Chthonomonadaceae bacterium]MDW8207142.1 galactose-1-phosphate uridylyltransferase [Chloroherpetonaceae bacterium]